MRCIARWYAPVTVVAVCGCGVGEVADPGFTLRDSVGIEIVESLEPAWGEGEGWRLTPQPILAIGVVSGDPVYQFDGIRDVARWPDDRIAVVDGGSQEVRVYDAEGRFVRAVGGEGDGPGEFRYLSAVVLRPADTILAIDAQARRWTAFDGDGTVVWSTPLWEGGYPYGRPASFDDGSFVLALRSGNVPSADEAGVGQIHSEQAVVLRHSAEAVLLDTLGTFRALSGVWIPWTNNALAITSDIPFGPRLSYAARGDLMYVGEGIGYEIRAIDQTGSLVRIVRRQGLDLQVSEGAVDSFWNARIEPEDDPRSRDFYERLADNTPPSAQRTPYRELLVDSEGHLWVGQYQLGLGTPSRWDIFDPAGPWLGEMTVPTGFQVFEVGRDYILGVDRDELDVQHVRVYGLTR